MSSLPEPTPEEITQNLAAEAIRKLNKPRSGKYQPWEMVFIKTNCEFKSDAELAKQLNRSVLSITRIRKQMGMVKNQKPTNEQKAYNKKKIEVALSYKDSSAEEFQKLNGEQKKQLYDMKFKSTKRYKKVKQLLDEDELEFYMERWTDYIGTWETLLSTEEDQLHLAIMQLILGNRVLERQRDAIDDEDNRLSFDTFDRQYKDYVESYSKMMKDLSGTRQQRLVSNKEEKITLASVVQGLQDMEARRRVGQEAAAIEMAKNIAVRNMREKNYLID